MGLQRDIAPGGLFSEAGATPCLTLEETWSRNHPSFESSFQGPPPGRGLVEEYINAGLREIFTDLESASEHFGTNPRPSPLTTITKDTGDGSFNHRIIRDMPTSAINGVVRLPERQVLPRPVDHAVDL